MSIRVQIASAVTTQFLRNWTDQVSTCCSHDDRASHFLLLWHAIHIRSRDVAITGFISWSQSTNRIRRSREASQVHMSNNRLWQDDKYCHDRDSNNDGVYLFFITDGSFIQITFGYLLQTFLILIKFRILSLCIVLDLTSIRVNFFNPTLFVCKRGL